MTAPVTPEDRDEMIRTVIGEARGERPIGQAAVAHVILNRAATPAWWGKTITEVCRHPYQFSCWNKSDPNCSLLEGLHPDASIYKQIAGIVDVVLNVDIAVLPDPTGGATHYKVTGTPASWDAAAAHVEPVIIGRHSFYKLGPHA
jgi:N-acetylmuramoyl-L-alanine amidase